MAEHWCMHIISHGTKPNWRKILETYLKKKQNVITYHATLGSILQMEKNSLKEE